MRFGIVGTGAMARTMMKAMDATPGVRVVAVASRSQERAESFSRAHRIEHHFGDVPSLAQCPDVDIVYVASHPNHHFEDSRAALEAGKSVLCEKPLATSVVDAQRLADSASTQGVFLMEGMWLRFLPAVRHAERLVRDRVTGTPRLFQADFGYPVAAGSETPGTDVGVLLDRAVYPISLAIFLLGTPRESSALISRNQHGVASQASFTLRHDGGALSQLSVSSEALLSNKAVMCCEHGRIELAEPLLGTERVIVRQYAPVTPAPPSNGVPTTKRQIVDALKSSPFLRRLRGSYFKNGTVYHDSYGPNQYLPQLKEVVRCMERREMECSIMSIHESIETIRVIEQAQQSQNA